jgi:hypothetical protein
MRPTRLLLPVALILACATSRTAAPAAGADAGRVPLAALAPPPAPPAAPSVVPGMDAAQVRRLLGDPKQVERVPSAAAPPATYERWIYPGRQLVLLDGKVVDAGP